MQIIKSPDWKNVLKIIIPFFIVVALFQYGASKILGVDIVHTSMSTLSSEQLLIMEFFTTLGTVLVVWWFRKKIDKRSFISLGFYKANILSNFLWGTFLGSLIISCAFVGLLLTNQIRFVSSTFNFSSLLESMVLFILVAFSEELLMRGYVLCNLMLAFNKYVALLISALLFSLMHLGNENVSLLGIFGIFIAGIFLGVGYIYSKGLWLPIALHFSWNFFQGTIFGFNVSGNHVYSIINIDFLQPNIWNGGNFGFEGSVLSILFQSVGIYFLVLKLKERESKIANRLAA